MNHLSNDTKTRKSRDSGKRLFRFKALEHRLWQRCACSHPLLTSIGFNLLVVALVWSKPIRAEELKASISIRVIYATKDKTKSLDPKLKNIKAELFDLPFTRFRLLDQLTREVAINSTVELQIPTHRSISIRFMGLDGSGSKEMLSLSLAMRPKLKMNLRIANGGRMLAMGPKHLEGSLLLDVSATLKEIEP